MYILKIFAVNNLMKLIFSFVFALLISTACFAQEENYEFDNFTVSAKDKIVLAKTDDGQTFYSRKFDNAEFKEFLSDLDGDSIPEFCVKVSDKIDNNTYYKVYVYNAVDTFYLADSLESLNVDPFSVSDEDNGQEIYVVGNTGLATLATNKKEEITTSVDCYLFDGVNFVLANDQMYDIFIHQNDDLLDSLDEFYDSADKDCANSKKMATLIGAIYINLKNANEDSMALHFINKYYFCDDLKDYVEKLNSLIKVKKNETELE